MKRWLGRVLGLVAGLEVACGSSAAAPTYDLDADRCAPGTPRCNGDFGYQICEPNGTWGPSRSCAGYSEDGTSSYCIMASQDTGPPWAVCVDPACWYWISNGWESGPTAVGICTSPTTIRRCNAGGSLSNFTCSGLCTEVGSLDGRALGFCAPGCPEGSRECLGGPVYRECVEGRWIDPPKECAGGETCNPLGASGKADIRCGGACEPGTSRCARDQTSVEVCGESGAWEAGKSCLFGACRSRGPEAQCEAECSPGQHQCAYDGAASERRCEDSHLWTGETPCEAGTICRTSGARSLGCVLCVGPSDGWGNDFGVADSRCELDGVARCGADHVWSSASPCDVNTRCTELRRGVSSIAFCAAP